MLLEIMCVLMRLGILKQGTETITTTELNDIISQCGGNAELVFKILVESGAISFTENKYIMRINI